MINLEGARTQQQVDTEPVRTPIDEGKHDSISALPPAVARFAAHLLLFLLLLRSCSAASDGYAPTGAQSAVRISTGGPSTTANTPMSKETARWARGYRRVPAVQVWRCAWSGRGSRRRPRPLPVAEREQQADGDPAARIDAQVLLHPLGARDDELQHQRHRHHQPATKPPPGALWPRMKKIDRHQHRQRQRQAHQHRGHRQGSRRRSLACAARVQQVAAPARRRPARSCCGGSAIDSTGPEAAAAAHRP